VGIALVAFSIARGRNAKTSVRYNFSTRDYQIFYLLPISF
jgi:hypothetical protein